MRGLLCASFGTSYAQTRMKTIDAVEHRLTEAFPERAFYSAWTSNRIIEKVRNERGEQHDTLEGALARISADGITDLLVATMCLMPGNEWNKISAAVRSWTSEAPGRTARVAMPLLATERGRHSVAQAICDEFAQLGVDEALVLMGHGSRHESNEVYRAMRAELAAMERPLFYVATVEGEPSFNEVLAEIRERNIKRTFLAPLMIVAGEHATRDLAGSGQTSWKSILAADGIHAEAVLKGLGEYNGVQKLVCDLAANAQVQG